MDSVELFQRLGLALAIGTLIGIERGWRKREMPENSRAAGLRTFALSGLLGGVLAALQPVAGALPLAFGLVAHAAVFAAYRWREARRNETYGATTVVAGLLAFALGAFAVLGDMAAATAAAVAATLMLALRAMLHGWLQRLTWEELRAGLLLATMTFLALPLLPNQGMGPWQAINPYEIWLLTILIAGVSFIGYVAVRVAGQERGFLIGGAVGGLVASTAVTLAFSRLAREHPENARAIAAGAVIAGALMMARILVVVGMLNPALLPSLAPPLLGGALGATAAAFALSAGIGAGGEGAPPKIELRNPFDFWMAVRFGVLLALVFLLARAVQEAGGDAGVLALAAVSGVADVDAITLSMARLAQEDLAQATAVLAILIAAAVNTVSKTALGWVAGGRRAGWPLTLGTLAAAAGAAAGYAIALLAAPAA